MRLVVLWPGSRLRLDSSWSYLFPFLQMLFYNPLASSCTAAASCLLGGPINCQRTSSLSFLKFILGLCSVGPAQAAVLHVKRWIGLVSASVPAINCLFGRHLLPRLCPSSFLQSFQVFSVSSLTIDGSTRPLSKLRNFDLIERWKRNFDLVEPFIHIFPILHHISKLYSSSTLFLHFKCILNENRAFLHK